MMGICIGKRVLIPAAALCALLLASCGETVSDQLRTVNTGTGVLPGVVGVQGGMSGGAVDTGSQSTPLTLESEAPLGVDEQYAPDIYEPDSTVETSHSTSVVVGVPSAKDFEIIDLTMMHDGQPANWDLTRAAFNEGENIDLWIKYETFQPLQLDRHWLSTAIKLNYNEYKVSHIAGVYSVKLDWTVPFNSAQTNAFFQFDLASGSNKKYSQPFPYDILAPNKPVVWTPPTGDGDPSVPGYGKGWTTMAAEDLLVDSDFDYNDFVARMQGKEYRDSSGNLLRIELRVKAIARGAGYDASWQLNFNGAFPGAVASATVNQYYANGMPHGPQRLWKSTGGVSIPVFGPLRDALPQPPTSFATNTVTGTKYIDGDYSDVVITFDKPVKAGTYAAFPYAPELRVQPSGGKTYSVKWWTKPGDQTDSFGNPLAFFVPDTFAWPQEFEPIWNVYPSFKAWATWINKPGAGTAGGPKEPATKWYDTAPRGKYFQRSLFK